MAKATITKKLVEENSQLADLLTERNLKVGSKVEQTELDELIKLSSQDTKEVIEEITEKQVYTVVSDFEDKFDRSIRYNAGDEVPADFTEDRIQDLLNRNLIK